MELRSPTSHGPLHVSSEWGSVVLDALPDTLLSRVMSLACAHLAERCPLAPDRLRLTLPPKPLGDLTRLTSPVKPFRNLGISLRDAGLFLPNFITLEAKGKLPGGMDPCPPSTPLSRPAPSMPTAGTPANSADLLRPNSPALEAKIEEHTDMDTALEPAPSARHVPSLSSATTPAGVPRLPPGFANMGLTCYFSAALQLAACNSTFVGKLLAYSSSSAGIQALQATIALACAGEPGPYMKPS
jgi:hypothetical protein